MRDAGIPRHADILRTTYKESVVMYGCVVCNLAFHVQCAEAIEPDTSKYLFDEHKPFLCPFCAAH